MIKNIIFDVGDVLLSYRWKQMLMDYGLPENEAVRIGTELFEDEEGLWHILDLGTHEDSEIIERYCTKYPGDSDAIRWFIGHGEFMHVGRPRVWRLVRELKNKGYRIYLLSNYSESLFKKHTMYADFLEDIDGMLVSYMIHKAKPDKEIYEELLRRFSLKRDECLFFDDRKENVDAANKLGIKAIQVVSQEGLIEDLMKILN